MTLSITAAFIWLIVANLRAMFPSKDHHWKFAYVMIAIGIPILIGVALQKQHLVGAGGVVYGGVDHALAGGLSLALDQTRDGYGDSK